MNRQFPKKKEIPYQGMRIQTPKEGAEVGYTNGWNDCLDAVGECEIPKAEPDEYAYGKWRIVHSGGISHISKQDAQEWNAMRERILMLTGRG